MNFHVKDGKSEWRHFPSPNLTTEEKDQITAGIKSRLADDGEDNYTVPKLNAALDRMASDDEAGCRAGIRPAVLVVNEEKAAALQEYAMSKLLDDYRPAISVNPADAEAFRVGLTNEVVFGGDAKTVIEGWKSPISIAADTWAHRQDEKEKKDRECGPSVHVDLSQIRQCPDRQKALDEYRKAMATADTDLIPKPVKGISWSVWALILAAVTWAGTIVYLWVR
jgi:hypothetical protein